MNVDPKWIDVVTNPLGLAGFALFLVFLLTSRPAGKKAAWLTPAFVGLAVVALVGGIGLAAKVGSGESEKETAGHKIETHGPFSPGVITKGNVTMNIGVPNAPDEHSGKPKPAAPKDGARESERKDPKK